MLLILSRQKTTKLAYNERFENNQLDMKQILDNSLPAPQQGSPGAPRLSRNTKYHEQITIYTHSKNVCSR